MQNDALLQGLLALNVVPEEEALEQLLRCCHSRAWSGQMLERRPFASILSLHQNADEIWWSLGEEDWNEAFAAHPRIGDVEALKKVFVHMCMHMRVMYVYA
jgi:2-oxo-4-hydroxy-4-carboxy-5-ureidoimidazoline decarboxylase